MRLCRPLMCAAFSSAILFVGPAAQAQTTYELPDLDASDGVTADGYWANGEANDGAYADAQARPLPPQPVRPVLGYSSEEREDWLAQCRRRYGDNGVGGAIIGGVLGGVVGNRVAGKGNRTVGTVAGAAVGAVAGAAIDKAEDAGRVRDACEDYLARYEAGYGAGYPSAAPYPPGYSYGGGYGYGYGYSGVAWVPVMIPGCSCDCKPKTRKIVTEEWIEEKPARRAIPKKTKLVPVKAKTVRTRLVPAKAKSVPIK